MSRKIDLLFVDADIHAGSTVSPCPPDFQVTDGGRYRLNKPQQWLWDAWNQRVAWQKKLAKGRRFGVVVNGDAVEGDHHRSTQLVSPDMNIQRSIAVEVLAMATTGADRVWMVHGTDAHVGPSTESEVGFHLGAERDETTGFFFFHHLLVRINGTLCSFQHHVSTTKRKYLEGGALSIEAGNEQLAAARAGQDVPLVMGRAHRHLYGQYTDERCVFVVSPPWKLLDNYARKVAPGSRPAVGSYALDFAGPPGSLPRVVPFVRQFPQEPPQEA